MAVTYDKIAYDEIELGLRKIINDEFKNVYISNTFEMKGTECIRINLESSATIQQATNFEERDYNVMIRYYHLADTSKELINKSVKANIDRLRKHLLDNQVNTANKWSALIIDDIQYNVEDEENDENSLLHIAEFSISIQHYNQF